MTLQSPANFLHFLQSENIGSPDGDPIRKSFDKSVAMKFFYHFTGGLLVELQWQVNQNKMAVGFLETTCYSLGKVTSLLGEKVCFSWHCSKIFEIFLV